MPICPKCGQQSSELGGKCPYDEFYFVEDESAKAGRRDPMLGTIIADKYIVIALINEGGMGAVYRALQTPIGREVALKVLRAELRESEQGGDRFIREARAVARLQHPNIIHLHDFGFDEVKHPYMVMEYAPGLPLTRWLKTERLTYERIFHVTSQILSALHEAHERGIVHRDLKPDNMIIVRSGTDKDFVKLLDFGIARVINEGATKSLTREGEVFGTPHYMAPEQARGEKDIGPPADVYAVGIMLFEMLTGQQPYDAPTPLAVLFQHINEPLPHAVPRAGVTMPEAMQEILRMATAKSVQDRYQTAAEFLKALELATPNANMQAVLSAVIQDSLNPNTLPPGSRPISTQQLPGRIPMVTPGGFRSDVAVYDPDPSIEQPAPHFVLPVDEGEQRKKTVGLLSGVVLMLALLVGFIVYALSSTPAEQTTEVETTPPVVEPKDPVEPVKTGLAKADEKSPEIKPVKEPAVDETNAVVDVGTKSPVVADTKKLPEVAPVNVAPKDTKVTTAKDSGTKTTKKVVKKVEEVATPVKPAEKPVEEPKDTKATPVKFAPVDTRKW